MTSFSEGKPKYLQLFEDLLTKIEDGEFEVGKQIPSENAIATEYSVNRHTARQALQKLKDEGFIYSKRGKGNFVSNVRVPYKITDKSNYSSQIMNLGYEPKTEVLEGSIVTGDKELCKHLEVKAGSKLVKLILLRYADDMPVSISSSYFDANRFAGILECLECQPFSLYKALKELIDVDTIIKESCIFEAKMPTKEEAKTLMIPQKFPLLLTTTLSRDTNGVPVEYGTNKFRADLCKVKMDLT